MPIDPTALKAEIDADPLALGYAARVAAGDDAGIAALLNAKSYRGPVPIKELSSYCTRGQITGAVEMMAYEPTDEAGGITRQLKGLCRGMLTLIRDDYRLDTCDVDDPAFGPGCDALIAAGLMTADQKAAILALAEGRSSRAEVLWGDGAAVAVGDISYALRGRR